MRYFIAKTIQVDDPGFGTYNTTACARHPSVGMAQLIDCGPDGNPVRGWALVAVNATDYSAFNADPDIIALPDMPLDGQFGSLSVTWRSMIITILQARGIDTGSITASSTFRDILHLIGRAIEPSFDVSRLRAG